MSVKLLSLEGVKGETLNLCKGQLYQDLPIQQKELRQNDKLPMSSCVFKQMTNY